MTAIKERQIKNQRKRYLTAAIVCVSAAAGIIMSDEFADSIRRTLAYTVLNVIPALFPFMVLSRFMISTGVDSVLEGWLGGIIGKIFSVRREASGSVILGLLSGFPVGASSVCEKYSNGRLSKNDAQHAVCVAHNTGPAFPISVIGASLWHSAGFGAAVYASQVLSLIIVSRVFYRVSNKQTSPSYPVRPKSISTALTDAISVSSNNCIGVIGFIVFWRTVSDMTVKLIPAELKLLGYVTSAMLEFSSGCFCGEYIGSVTGALLTGAAVGFGGVSAIMQASHSISKACLSVKQCISFKLIQGVLCSVFCGAAYLLIF